MAYAVLIDDDDAAASSLRAQLAPALEIITPRTTPTEATVLIQDAALVIVDLVWKSGPPAEWPHDSGIELLVPLRRQHPGVPIAAMSGIWNNPRQSANDAQDASVMEVCQLLLARDALEAMDSESFSQLVEFMDSARVAGSRADFAAIWSTTHGKVAGRLDSLEESETSFPVQAELWGASERLQAIRWRFNECIWSRRIHVPIRLIRQSLRFRPASEQGLAQSLQLERYDGDMRAWLPVSVWSADVEELFGCDIESLEFLTDEELQAVTPSLDLATDDLAHRAQGIVSPLRWSHFTGQFEPVVAGEETTDPAATMSVIGWT